MANTLAFCLPLLLAASYVMAAPSETVELSRSVSQFSNELYQKAAEGAKGNVILSPYSVAVALALASQGAEGNTYEEIKKGLHLTGDKQTIANNFKSSFETLTKGIGNSTLSIANKVFVQEGRSIKKSFNDVAVQSFKSEGETVNFAQSAEATDTINNWVEGKTNNKIKNLLSPSDVNSGTRAVLVNAIYFKGNWEHKFHKDATRKEPFWVTPTESVEVDFMHNKQDYFYGALPDLDATALELKYNGSDVSFLIILPNKRDGLPALEASLQNVDLSEVTKQLYKTEVEIAIPKFKVEFKLDLVETLKKLGFKQLFTDSADFSSLLDSPEPLKVGKVIHQAFIDVNEEGAEAAAATGITIKVKSARINLHLKHFHADHPFFFGIVQKTESSTTTLFSGRYIKN